MKIVVIAIGVVAAILLFQRWRSRRIYWGESPDGLPMFQAAESNEAMNEAMEQARSTVGHFIWQLEAASENCDLFAVKVPIDEEGYVEHIWVGDLQIEGDEFVGKIGNEPDQLTGVKEGDEWRCARDKISDWTYEESGMMHGNYTLRVILPNFPPEQREQLEAQLADLPQIQG